MYVLGIETSCDETAASVVKNGKFMYSNVVASSLQFHKKYGGIIPEIASRMHLNTITYVTDSALFQANIKARNLGLIAVTQRPGLPGSLLVGICFAKSMGMGLNIPFLGINHLQAHIYSVFLNKIRLISFPMIGLVVSGGHTSLFFLKDFARFEPLGSTLDDACGEAFDKVAKILGLGYPGGPIIERLAKSGTSNIEFKCGSPNRAFDFSFSGIKTAVLYYVRKKKKLTIEEKSNIAASFQEAVIEVLINKSFLACKLKKTKNLIIGGGVALNNRLRQRFSDAAQYAGIKVYFPDSKLCTDNAAMVAGLGYHLFRKGYASSLDVTPNASS